MKIRFYKGNKTLKITESSFSAEFRLQQLAKAGVKWASDKGVKWQIDGDIKEPKKVTKKTTKKDEGN
jgi:hypothetical protein